MQVEAVLVQPDGKILLTGVFERVNGVARPRVARLNADGSLDTSFDPGPDRTAASSRRAATGRQGGHRWPLRKRPGCPRKGIARLNEDGSLDTSFDPGTGVDHADAPACSPWRCNRRQGAGRRWFEWVNGIPRTHVVRLLPNGSVDAVFAPQVECSGWAAAWIDSAASRWPGAHRRGPRERQRRAVSRHRPAPRRPAAAVICPARNSAARDLTGRHPTNQRQRVRGGRPGASAAVIAHISHGGVFDERTGKVKFGPFYDMSRAR